MEEAFNMKTVIASHGEAADIVKKVKILNRVIRATPEGCEYECDQRHAETMIEAMGLKRQQAAWDAGCGRQPQEGRG